MTREICFFSVVDITRDWTFIKGLQRDLLQASISGLKNSLASRLDDIPEHKGNGLFNPVNVNG